MSSKHVSVALFVVIAALVGCSSDSTSSSSTSFKCCVNGTYYDCKTEEQMKSCGTTAMTCPSDSSKNDLCK